MNLIKEKIVSDTIDGLIEIKLDTFEDYRGEIWTVFSEEFCDHKFVADKITISEKGVLRGYHGDPYTAKLISCLHGSFQFSVVDLRKDSKTYGNVENFIMTDKEPSVILVPAGCINAHQCLTEKCVFYYKWSEHYKGLEHQITVSWDDPDIGTIWQINPPILSERDKNGEPLGNICL